LSPFESILPPHAEWLEPDGLGGFASGTTLGFRTRRYHALLLAAAEPPASRFALVQSVALRLETPGGALDLFPEVYAGGTTTGLDPAEREFTNDPWPTFHRDTPWGVGVTVEVFVPHGRPAVALSVRLERPLAGARLELRPLLSGRDFHALHHENPALRMEAEFRGRAVRFAPYPGVPAVLCLTNGDYRAAPDWYRNFFYAAEAERGLDAEEDLATPGIFSFDLSRGEAVCLLSAELPDGLRFEGAEPTRLIEELRHRELDRRKQFAGPLERAADAYLVRRGRGHTILAGYPWFGDWGRDSFIAIRGLCFARGELEIARDILSTWASAVSEGMLPNRFADRAGDAPEYNSVDASLWFVLAVHELCERDRLRGLLSDADRRRLDAAVIAIVDGYGRGTRHGIFRDHDGLLAAGEPSVQLTWMDAKVGDRVITPRSGKPVEIQALWLHALGAAAEREPRFQAWFDAARAAFEPRFWNAERAMLFDVVDVGRRTGENDPACRPNQIFAAGGLPLTLIAAERARSVVDAVERELWTPLGLRSLERGNAAYRPHYTGGVAERDAAYHQGTVWPWLLGAFVEAWVKSRGGSTAAKREARNRFVVPLLHHVEQAGLDHVSEITDAEDPFTPRGCPFQAWSVGELLRLEREVLA
jgi:predicted glycogen debranching enzyme